jgi:mRNA interferase MazF
MDLVEIRRGEVWWVVLDPTAGSEAKKRRPCVIVQRDSANANSPMTVICPLTDARDREIGITNILVKAGRSGLKKDSLVVCNQIRAVNRSRLGSRIGYLDADTMRAVDRGLRAILDV